MNRTTLAFALILATAATTQAELPHATKAKAAPAAPTARIPLPEILAKLDADAAHFHNAQAKVRYDTFTAVIHADDVDTGSLYIERSGKNITMGAIYYEGGTSTPSRIVNFNGKELLLYSPGNNQEDVFAAGANQARYESFLTLGFGGSGRELAAQWNINNLGTETINGIQTAKLDLVSKDPAVRKIFTHVTIWLDLSRGLSLRQIFYQPSGDHRTADYSDIQENASINKKLYAIKKGAQIVRH